jgi:hypothetical protein
MPDTPVILQVADPVGVWPPFGPVTVAEKVKLLPSEVEVVLGNTDTDGITFDMLTPSALGPAEK